MLPCNFKTIRFIENECYTPPVINRCYEPVVPTYNCYEETRVVCKPVVTKPICKKPAVKRCCTPVIRKCYDLKPAVEKCLCEKSYLNKDGSFFVFISQKHPYLQLLIDKAHSLGLTISGDGSDNTVGGDITYANVGNYISFGSSSRFDMNWIRRSQYVAKKGYRPVYDMVYDWGVILKALKEFADNKKNNVRCTTGGDKVVAHAGFTVVNGVVKRNRRDDVTVRMPISTLTNVTHRHEIGRAHV